MHFSNFITLAATCSSMVYAQPVAENVETAIEARANPGSNQIWNPQLLRPGVNVIWSSVPSFLGNNAFKMRVFGPFSLSPPAVDPFTEVASTAQDIAGNVFAHCQQYVTKSLMYGSDFANARWTGLLEGGAKVGENFVGVAGAAVDYGGVLDKEVTDFLSQVQAYWANQGYTVTVTQVTDAYQAGSPALVGNSKKLKRDVLFQQVCRKPTDLRHYFTNDVPTVPDEWFNC